MFKQFIIVLFLLSVFLLFSCTETDPVEPTHEHFEAVGMALLNADSSIYIKVFEGQIVSENKEIKLRENDSTDFFIIKFYDEHGDFIDVPEDEHKEFDWEVLNTSLIDVTFKNDNGWFIKFKGIESGNSKIIFKILHEGHNDFITPEIPVIIE